ncbi:MAG: alanine--glyoxylate aminotransferase family protein, partial [Lachnospiraceae bacterium]|nr:alanine--glyoxylate aminotransferase family protein [Lachnospiraceae bacterium]
DFCARNGLFLVVDAISAFLADELHFSKWGIDILITASQKAVALPPGMSYLILSQKAIARAEQINCPCMYFNIPDYLKNGERGQTPFTPAVGVLLQLHERLTQISKDGIGSEQKRIAELAAYFRGKLAGLPFELLAESPSNAVTALKMADERSAYEIFVRLDQEYNIWICPNGGELKETVFRVGHIGALEEADYDRLLVALREICK